MTKKEIYDFYCFAKHTVLENISDIILDIENKLKNDTNTIDDIVKDLDWQLSRLSELKDWLEYAYKSIYALDSYDYEGYIGLVDAVKKKLDLTIILIKYIMVLLDIEVE